MAMIIRIALFCSVLSFAQSALAVETVQVFRQVKVAQLTCATGTSKINFNSPAKGRAFEFSIPLDLCHQIQVSQQFPVEFFVKEARVIGVAFNNEYLAGLPAGTISFSTETN